MFTGIILTAGSIGVMCAAGAGMNALLTWFNTYEFQPKNKKGGSRGVDRASDNRERVDRLSNSFRP